MFVNRTAFAAIALLCASLVFSQAAQAEQSSSLIDAAKKDNLAMVKALIAAGDDVNAKGDKGITALIEASNKGHLDVVQALIAAGADVNAKWHDGWTALKEASFNGHLDVVRVLIAAMADVNAKDSDRVDGVDSGVAERPPGCRAGAYRRWGRCQCQSEQWPKCWWYGVDGGVAERPLGRHAGAYRR